jgi:uncharacterized membrane protein YcaP (DUF421 family)
MDCSAPLGGLAGLNSWLFGEWRTAGYVALSSLLIYLSVVVALRVGERRTLTEMTVYDFAVAVALGAIIGRTATSRTPTYVQGVVATITLLASHNLVTWLRARWPLVRRVTDRGPIVLVRDGRPDTKALARANVTEDDLRTVLRQYGTEHLQPGIDVVLESRGAFSVIDRSSNTSPT